MSTETKAAKADRSRLNHLDAVAEKVGCGWSLDKRGLPLLKHYSQEPPFANIRDAIDAGAERGLR